MDHYHPYTNILRWYICMLTYISMQLTLVNALMLYIYMWPNLPKGSYTHTVSSLLHFSSPFDWYNNRLTVDAYTIAKGLTVYFYLGLIHGPVWHPWMLGWSVNGSNFPGQADSWQGITIRLAGETGHWCSYILWWVSWKQPELMWFGHIIFFNWKVLLLRGFPSL